MAHGVEESFFGRTTAGRSLRHGGVNCFPAGRLRGSNMDLSSATHWNRSYEGTTSPRRFAYFSGAGQTQYSTVPVPPTSFVACWLPIPTTSIQLLSLIAMGATSPSEQS